MFLKPKFEISLFDIQLSLTLLLKFVSREKSCNDAIRVLGEQMGNFRNSGQGSNERKLVRFVTAVGTSGKGYYFMIIANQQKNNFCEKVH